MTMFNLNRVAKHWPGCVCALVLGTWLGGCDRRAGPDTPASEPSDPSVATAPAAAVKPRDRLFGLELPPTLRVTRRFDDMTYLISSQSVGQVTELLAKHVQVQHIRVEGTHNVFPRAYFKTDKKKTLLSIEVAPAGSRTQVRIKDITPPPVTQGLSEPKRWEQAGRNPDGSLKDRLRVD